MHTDSQKPFDMSETVYNVPGDNLIDNNITEDAKKRKKRPWLRYGCGGLLINVLTSFFQRMESQKFEDAYQLLSQRGKKITALETLIEMGSDTNTILFSDFEDIEIQSLQIRRQFNTYELAPKGTIATVRALSKYSEDIQGNVTAILEKENGAWYLHTINITVPTTKQE